MRRLAALLSPVCTLLQVTAVCLMGAKRTSVVYVYSNKYYYHVPRQRARF